MFRIQSRRSCACHSRQLRSTVLAVVLPTMLAVTGCAHLKARPTERQGTHPPAVTVAAAPQLDVIVNDELQRGHYAEGEKALRQYIAQHPGDQPAQFMLHQLTVDPERMLGHASRPYVVQAGDTFSALAARYLGDPNLFLVLARYNGSTNPSRLSAGTTIRLPTSTPGRSMPVDVTAPRPSGTAPGPNGTAPGPDGTEQPVAAKAASKVLPTPVSGVEAAAAKAARLQAESVALSGQGHEAQALERLGEALDIDPRLPSAGSRSVALRKKLLANYHQRAVILYRDQHLDQAIALWNHVLAIDPNYEPARIYRARALELKQRLKQF